MALGDRKLVPNDPVLNLTESCMHFCNSTIKVDNSTTGFCPPPCLVACPLICLQPLVPHLLPPSSPSHSSSYSPSVPEPNESHSLSPILISMLIILASTFLIVFFYVIYLKFYSSSSSSQTNRRRRRGTGTTLPSPGPNGGHHRQRSDGTFGDAPVHIVDLDHPIWYIATVGLQPSVIKSITACKYKKSDGVIEGTDCAVCLTEFEDEDILRLLPKCNHAFHISCIDTWLRSHKNCPLCRAPIVSDSRPPPVRIGNLMTVPAAVGDSRNENETSGGAGEARIRVEEAEEERGDLDGAADDGGGRRARSNKEKELRENSAASRRSASMERRLDVELATDEVASSSSGGQRTRGSSGASASVRWLVGGRSLSCSGKIFSSRYSRGG